MPTTTRILPIYTRNVEIPGKYYKYLWDHPGREVILEKFILRILMYGKFQDVKWLYKKYTVETYEIANKYSEVHRGVLYWINLWHLREWQ